MRIKNRGTSSVPAVRIKGFKAGRHLAAGIAAAALMGMALGAGGAMAEEAKCPAGPSAPETVSINIQEKCPDMKGLGKDKKAVPEFSHKAHVEKYLPGNSKYSPKPYTDEFVCAGCHAGYTDEKELLASDPCKRLEAAIEEKDGKRDVKNYFHSQCLACHKAMKKDKVATGPTSCKGCHSKKK